MAREKCGARTSAGAPCRNVAGFRTDHLGVGACYLHGGCTPNHQKSARVELARQAVVTYGLPREVDPAQALLEEVHRTAGHVAWLGMVVAELERQEVVWGVAEETERPGLVDEDGEQVAAVETKRKAGVNVWVQLYQAERKHLAAVCRDAMGADAQGRMTAVFEQIGRAYQQMFERVLDQLELSEVQRARVPDVVTAELQAIAGGAA